MKSRQSAQREIIRLQRVSRDLRREARTWSDVDIKRDSEVGKFELRRLRAKIREIEHRIKVLCEVK